MRKAVLRFEHQDYPRKKKKAYKKDLSILADYLKDVSVTASLLSVSLKDIKWTKLDLKPYPQTVNVILKNITL